LFSVSGWIADFFRFVWGLLSWNIRKTRFRLRRGRVPCPCQSPGDSGRALETRCEASLTWDRPARFRRVCPLLVHTPDGLRCSVNTADVRPFWGRAAGYYGGALAGLYLAGVLGAFVFLRAVGYPVQIADLAWPGAWHRVGEARGRFFLQRADDAFAAGQIAAGQLYLRNAYEFDPDNTAVGLALARRCQLNDPALADSIFERLLRESPARPSALAEEWFRSLLARGNFDRIQQLAADEVIRDPTQASVWMRALFFATRETGNDTPLRALLGSPLPAAHRWKILLQTELDRRAGRTAAVRTALGRDWSGAPPYALYYQADALIDLDDASAALDRLESYGAQLDGTARALLQLKAYTRLDVPRSRQRFLDALLAPPLHAATVTVLCAHLIRHPDPALLDRLYAAFVRTTVPSADTLGTYLSLYCTAGVARDWPKLDALAKTIETRAGGRSLALGVVETFFHDQSASSRIVRLLPALPMPLEIDYALLERYPGRRPAATASAAPP
jgi:hypothetical protein